MLVKTVTISSGQSLSGATQVPSGHGLCGILMPAAWTAASLTFQGSADNSTFGNLYNTAGGEFTSSAAASNLIALDPVDFLGCGNIKVRSGTSGSAVAQGADRIITLFFRNVQ